MINKSFSYLLFALLISYCVILPAWNFQGHQLISDMAYSGLSKQEQKKLDAILKKLLVKLPYKDKKIIKKQPYSLSIISKLSIMPDLWKNYKFHNLYEILDITNDDLTQGIDNQKTNNWHYRSVLIENNKSAEGILDSIIVKLISNIKNTKTDESKALGIIFITHLLEDAHQPLHAMSKLQDNNSNSSDHGGNLYCLRYKQNRCSYNLHQYWDSAGGLLSNNSDIKELAKNIKTLYPANIFNNKTQDLSPAHWLNESFEYKTIVYNLPTKSMPNKLYQSKVRTITSERMALASYRLSTLLKDLVD